MIRKSDIAVIGMACRLPGCNDVNSFWKNIRNGVDLITTFSDEDLKNAGIPNNLLNQSNYIKRYGVINDIDKFDAEFFNIIPIEASAMDPQHRLFIECVWEALEYAGYNPLDYEGLIGLFAGSGLSQYVLKNLLKNSHLMEKLGPDAVVQLNGKDFLATRTAYALNLKGPAVSIQTACSTSLVAVHYACKSLLNGECNMAVAGGVTLLALQKEGYLYQEGMIMSSDGYCRAFDAKADGTVGGDGVSIVVLKLLKDAIEDGDFIHAVIRGTAINNDGNSKVGFTAPSVDGQRDVILEALDNANVSARNISYIEAHGTGTKMGDPIEIEALSQAFRQFTDDHTFCAIGSVKTNVGHTDTAAGCTSLIKVIQSLKHQEIPPSLYYETPNPQIDFEHSPFYVNTKLKQWSADGVTRLAGISSFGIGGTNAHIIVEDAPIIERNGDSSLYNLLLLSARSHAALFRMAENMLAHLKEHPDINMGDVAYTTQVGRKAFRYRMAYIFYDRNDLIGQLPKQKSKTIYNANAEKGPPTLILFFPNDCPSTSMMQYLYEVQSSFKYTVDKCTELLKTKVEFNINNEIFYQYLDNTLKAPKLYNLITFVIEYALATMYLSWGIKARKMLGDGIGQEVINCLLGEECLEETLSKIIDNRYIINKSSSDIYVQLQETKNVGSWIVLSMKFENSIDSNIKIEDDSIIKSSMKNFENNCNNQKKILIIQQQLWLSGIDLNWEQINAFREMRRIPLPTYPWEHKKYWIEPDQDLSVIGRAATAKVELSNWFYIPSWKIRPLLMPRIDQWNGMPPSNYLIFLDETGLGDELINQLLEHHQFIRKVIPGEVFLQVNENTFIINPYNRNDYDTLINELINQNFNPTEIIHLWNVTKNVSNNLKLDFVKKSQYLGYFSILFTAQAIKKCVRDEQVKFFVITSNCYSILQHDNISLEKSTISGLCKVIPQEEPQIRCHQIDISDNFLNQSFIAQLICEIRDASEVVVGYRRGNRFVLDYSSVSLEQSKGEGLLLKQGGVYLITGGFGKIGLDMANYLAKKVQAKLILIGRSYFPKRDNWQQYLVTHEKNDSISQKIQRILDMENQGAEVLLLNANIANKQELQQALKRALNRFGDFHGVIHAAGNTNLSAFQSFELMDEAACNAHFQPKIDGLINLLKLTHHKSFDFCILISSLASIIGGLGFSAYAAANAFMDIFAYYQSQRGKTPWISINWDGWLFDNNHLSSHEISKLAIDPNEGIDCLERILTYQVGPQIVVSTHDLQPRLNKWILFNDKVLEKMTYSRRLIHKENKLSVISPSNIIEQKLLEIWKGYLGLEEICIHDNYFELGGESLLAVRLMKEIQSSLEIKLTIDSLLQYPTIARLAEFIQLQKEVDRQEKQIRSELISNVNKLPFCLLPLREGNDSSSPIFLAHPVGGNVIFYRDLVKHLDTKRPIYGIRSNMLDGKSHLNLTLVEMAREYVEAILTIQPDGPYFFAGSSFGGTLIYEMSQQLADLNKKVKLIAMFDTPGASQMVTTQQDAEIFISLLSLANSQNSKIDMEKLNLLNESDKLKYILSQVPSEYKERFKEDMNFSAMNDYLRCYKANAKAMQDYIPRQYRNQGKIRYYRAIERDDFTPHHPEQDWLELLGDLITLHEVPGNHLTMMLDPHAKILAELLMEHFE